MGERCKSWHPTEPWPCERGPWHAGACVATVHGVTIEWPCPTVLKFHGETGETDCGGPILYLRFTTIGLGKRWWYVNRGGAPWLNPASACPAPTPEAP